MRISDWSSDVCSSDLTTMVVRKGERDLGAIGLMDTPRDAAKAAIEQLKTLGIARMIMISGDNQKVATAIAAQVGIDEAVGDLMPEGQVDTIKKRRAEIPAALRSEELRVGSVWVRTV